MKIRHLLWFALLFAVGLNASFAAEIRLLKTNPIVGEEYQFLNLTKNYDGFGTYEGNGRIPKKRPLDEIINGSQWAFDGGLGLDGSLGYSDTHLRATWSMLPSSQIIEVSGQIAKGDTARLKSLVAELNFSTCLRENYCPINNTIAFNSPGGSLVEAIKMGEYITSQSFATLVDRDDVCESACVFAFLAGYTNYEGFFFPRRYVHKDAKLGIHQPYFELPDQNYSLDQVQNIVKVVNLGINAATDYLLSSGIGFRFLKKMYETPPTGMYYLNPADMESDEIFILGRNESVSQLTRREFFKYCASVYTARYSEENPDLLYNLQSSGSEFLTFVKGKDFACFGVKQLKQDTWHTETCFDGQCQFASFGQGKIPVAQPTEQNKTIIYWDIATDLDNGGLGYAMEAYSRRSALLKYLRIYAEHVDFASMTPLKKLALQGAIPTSFCNEIDGFNPGLVLKVQQKLNEAGINVGEPDGAAGPNTRKGIARFNEQRTGRDIDTIDAKTLTAMGFGDEVVSEFKLCP